MQAEIQSEMVATTAEPGTNIPGYSSGVALSLAAASFEIGNFKQSKAVGKASGISFEAPLEAGDYDIRAWFTNESAQPFAANYIVVEKL
jgi:hypothetical protein